MLIAFAAALLVALVPAAPPVAASSSGWPLAAPDAAQAWRTTPVRDSLAHYYAQQQPAALARLCERAQTREDRLLCRYRLYPLTQDARYLRDIPSEQGVRSARELALIAALWAYRASTAPAWSVPTLGRRSERILGQARSADPNEPYVLLVEGQSLYYRPPAFGGNAREAQRRFEQLQRALRQRPSPGIHPFEADVWIWMALRKTDRAAAETRRRELLARRPPPLFRQFLIDPP
ncbi:MAG: hypothetical protein ACK41D_09735 [Rubricoccaceae bacterium]